jgi:hypothetical protein
MKFTLSLILIGSLVWSCTKEEDVRPGEQSISFPVINSVNGKYLFSKEEHAAPLNVGGTAYFRYIDNKLSKRSGGSISITSGGSVYTTDIYDTVQYSTPNSILIISKDNSTDFDVYSCKREITVDNGLITRKITYDEVTSQRDTDTMYYFYNSEKTLQKTAQYFKNKILTKDYYYDGSNNLQRIATVKKTRDDGFVLYTAEELFRDYDNKANPLKGQTLWQDLLYRTLSKNNFTNYSFTSGTNTETINWTLYYDSSGNVDYSK